MLRWSVFDLELLDVRPGFALMRVTGKKAQQAFSHEAGGHRFQRVPPNEKRGRVHTSTVTVAVLEEPKENEVQINPRDLDETFTRGSGAGGQHRNKTDSCVVLVHKPTGIKVRIDGGRSQYINRQTALEVLRARLKAQEGKHASLGRNATRRAQVGGGARGDKVRTIAIQRDTVTDHVTGRSVKAKAYLRGNLSPLWA
jgi:peptide chain release factor 1